ncbi:MAG TPA: hypothetical protein ENH82_16020 [bacterium]|nr:hypothetical protein [bacterium]
MAGTILGNISVGASSWVSWISAMEKTRKGFLAVSLTNPATTAASSIATGSVLELAGSFYTFTETAITLASGTASASVSFYYTVIPSAGGTTVTVVRNSITPTWVDSKQGFYASAASTTRYIGGGYIGTAATYYRKFIYTPQMLDYLIYKNKTRPILKKVLEIGEWNMDATQVIVVAHNLGSRKEIRSVSCIIEGDDTVLIPLDTISNFATPAINGGINQIVITGITVGRTDGGLFDSTSYNATASTVANRGWVFIEYEA